MSSSSKKSSSGGSSSSNNGSKSIFGLGCGCKDSKSISVTESVDSFDKSTRPPPPPTRDTSAEFSSSSFKNDDDDGPSLSGLLRELGDLEKTVLSLQPRPPTQRRRTRSEGRGMEESVVVVKETEDPLGDFRRSMLQMIVEKEIVGGEELRQLLRRFLALNSPAHHDVILRAFAGIWSEVFSGLDSAAAAPDRLGRSRSSAGYPPRRPR